MENKTRAAILAALTALSLGLIAVISWYAFELFSERNLQVADRAIILQALAALGTLLATVVLVGVTQRYVNLTRRLVEQSGPIVEAELRVAWLSPHVEQTGAIVTQLDALAKGAPDERYSVPSFAVQLRNSGNMSTTIDGVSIAIPKGLSFRGIDVPAGPTTPFELRPHSSETYIFEFQNIIALLKTGRSVLDIAENKIRAEVHLGSGKEIASEWENVPDLPR